MLTVTYRKHGIRLSHVWFATENEILNKEYFRNAGDLIFLHETKCTPDKAILYTTQNTLVKDLSPDVDVIFDSLGKHLKSHIRRAEREGIVSIAFYDSQAVLSDYSLLSTCKRLYEKMFSDKGMESEFNDTLAQKYCELNSLVIAIATIEEKPVGFCAMIYSGEQSRAWVSGFDFRSGEYDTHIMSRAQRLTNWRRLLWLKEHGVRWFDFGGINSFDEPNGIAQFKLEFENENKITYKNYLIPRTLLGRIGLWFFMKHR